MDDVRQVYSSFFEKFSKYISALPVLILAFAIYTIIMYAFNTVTASIGGRSVQILLGFIRWGLRLAIMSHLAGLMNLMNMRESLRFSDLTNYDSSYVGALSQVFFLLYLIELLADMLLGPALGSTAGQGPIVGGMSLYSIIFLLWTIFTEPSFEAVHIGGDGVNSIFLSLWNYWKTNFLVLLPFTLVWLLLYYVFMNVLMIRLGFIFLDNLIVFILVDALLKGIFFGLFYYSRDIFFRETYFSNPRSRAFKGGFR